MDEYKVQLDRIERNSLLAAKNVLEIEDVATLTGLSTSYIYRLTSTRQIPHYKPNGKTIYFDREEIEQWMKRNRVNTQEEAEQAAALHILSNPRNRK